MVSRPSDPILKWFRDMMKDRGLNTAALANSTNMPKADVRKALSGQSDMTLDQLIQFSEALGLTQEELGAMDLPITPSPDATTALPDPSAVHIDPWGNQPAQLFQVAFALGCDFYFLTDPSKLADSGIPSSVLTRYQDKPLPIKLDAAYHSYNKPIYSDEGIQLTLSFDNLYVCSFTWSSILQVVFFPGLPNETVDRDPDDAPPSSEKHPHLRLVT